MTKLNFKPKNLYLITALIFILFILFLTAIFPISLDELRLSHDTWTEVFKQIYKTLTTDCPRFMVIPYILLLGLGPVGRIIFIILNPFVQLFIILGLFFVITGRKIDFKTTKDYYLLLLLCLLYLLFVPNSSNTLFWMSGTFCYSWAFVLVLILLCLFRKTIDGKFFTSSFLKQVLMFIVGFIAGMSNENTGPMLLGLFILFLLYCKYKKIKISSFYYYALAGVALGILAMFGSGANKYRLYHTWQHTEWIALSISDKLFIYFHKFNAFLQTSFWLPVITLLGYLFVLYENKLAIVKNKNFLLGFLFCGCGFVLALVFFMSPEVGLRVYYSAVLFFFISFISLLLILQKLYKINLIKYFALGLFILWLVWLPLITIPYVSLYKADKQRRQTIERAVKNNKKEVFVNRMVVLRGPTDNLTILYYDILIPHLDNKLEKDFKIKLLYEEPNKLSILTAPII